MNYKKIIRPSEIQKEWEEKTKGQSIWTKQYHIPAPWAAVIIILAIYICRVPIIIFIVENNIPLPVPVIEFIEQVVRSNPEDYNFSLI